MASRYQNLPTGKKEKKRLPGKRCAVMFCDKTNADNVHLYQFPGSDEEPRRRKWISFVLAKRSDDWNPGSGYICSDHFPDDWFEGLGAYKAGYKKRLDIKKTAIPSIQVSPTPEQLNAARNLKRKLPLSASKPDKGNKAAEDLDSYSTPKRTSRATSKLTAHRVSTRHKQGNQPLSNAAVAIIILQAVTIDGRPCYSIRFPKAKKGGHSVREIKTKATYGKFKSNL